MHKGLGGVSWGTLAFIALVTMVAEMAIVPLLEMGSQKVFGKSAENVLSFGKAS